jgi:hypothetical protein
MSGEPLTLVEFGSQVEVELIDHQGNRESMVFVIVGEEAADMDQNLLSEQTPLAKAILGRAIGSVISYRVGDMTQVRIVRAGRVAQQSADSAERRQAILQKAISDAERTNAEMFSSSYTGKWGNYE